MELTEVHPLFVHFPIALLSVGYFFDVLYVVFKKTELESAGWWNLFLGIISSFVTIVTGFVADWEYGHFESPFPVFDTHGSIQLLSVFLFSGLFVWRWKMDKKYPNLYIKLSPILRLGPVQLGCFFMAVTWGQFWQVEFDGSLKSILF